MVNIEEEGFSYEELKSRLLDKLHNGGIHEKLLSQLRSKLFAELSLATRIKPLHCNNSNGVLISKVVDSIFVDYLTTRGLEFSLSVFLPESGIDSISKALNESDIIRALHLQRPNTAVLLTDGEGSFISRLLSSLSNFNDKPTLEKQAQTDFGVDDLMHIKLRDMDKTIRSRAAQYDNSQSLLLEERMYSFQRDLEAASALQLEKQLENFKRVELAKLKLEEKTLLHAQLQSQKLEYEAKLLAVKTSSTELIQQERARVAEREKEMDRQNLALKQQLLDDHNNSVIKERQLRNELELDAKQISMERDQLQNRVTEVQQQLDKLSEFKDRYTQRMEESMAQYKIDLNKEYSKMISSVEIEKMKLQGDQMILREKELSVEKLLKGLEKKEDDLVKYKNELNDALIKIDGLVRDKNSMLGQLNDLNLQLLTKKGNSTLEYEIASLKKQLEAAERANTQKQNDYDALLKSSSAKDGSLSDISQSWKKKCQDLVLKLDAEFINSDELSQKLERHRLKNKELEKELSDTRLLLHQAHTALKLGQNLDYVPNISADSDLDTDPFQRYANISYHQTRSSNSHKLIPLPSQFDIPEILTSHSRVNEARKSDEYSEKLELIPGHNDVDLDIKSSKSVQSPVSKLPIRIPSALKEGRGLTRSTSADLKSSKSDAQSDMKTSSLNKDVESGLNLPLSPDTRQGPDISISKTSISSEDEQKQKEPGSKQNINIDPQLQRYIDSVGGKRQEHAKNINGVEHPGIADSDKGADLI